MRAHKSNERVAEKSMIKQKRREETDFMNLKKMIDRNTSYQKRIRKREDEKREMLEAEREMQIQKIEQKKSKKSEMNKSLQQRLNSIESKNQQREGVLVNLKQALENFTHQKREHSLLKKQDQEQNLFRQRRVQS